MPDPLTLADVQAALSQPFPAAQIEWTALKRQGNRALVVPQVRVSALHARLDTVCPALWTFEVIPLERTAGRELRGSLSLLGQVRQDVGQGLTFTAAADDALRRCAAGFGLGRDLADVHKQWVDWDEDLWAWASARAGHPTSSPDRPLDTGEVMLHLDVPDHEVLLSDAVRWDMVLHGHPLHTPGEAKCYRQACDLLGLPDHWSHDHPDLRRRIEASWHRCLHPAPAVPGLRTDPTSAVQAVLWTIQPGHVTAWRTPKGQVHR